MLAYYVQIALTGGISSIDHVHWPRFYHRHHMQRDKRGLEQQMHLRVYGKSEQLHFRPPLPTPFIHLPCLRVDDDSLNYVKN